MKAILPVHLNGQVVGYINNTGDDHQNALLADKLYDKLGVPQQSKVQKMLMQARAFNMTCRGLHKSHLDKHPIKPEFAPAFIVNATFACEVYIKRIYELRKKEYKETHSLSVLYKQLHNKDQYQINKVYKQLRKQNDADKSPEQIKEAIKTIANAFVDWRYLYEKKGSLGSVNAGTVFLIIIALEMYNVELDEQAKEKENAGQPA
ncbi:hypothetical protein M9194_19590 [Vibrio sp. S4M6]|uniref:hypothetical protein n=1 Tax=Vibrio sinus TaxID=2946865 RepID=UPI00202A8214|nr:hypothetical protein [Vibrio sinus]MCL9783631.1 hypothetical protein [Vibrio sinus]